MNQYWNKGKDLLLKAAGAVKKIGKRNVAILCAVVLLAGAVAINVRFLDGDAVQTGAVYYLGQADAQASGDGGEDQQGNANAGENDYFAATILTRQRSRDEALAVLQTIVENKEALPESVENAIAEMNQIARDMENESNIETLVKAKGFKDCVAVISGEKCSVIVRTEGLLPNHVAQIQEIVFEQTGILPEHVKMIEKLG